MCVGGGEAEVVCECMRVGARGGRGPRSRGTAKLAGTRSALRLPGGCVLGPLHRTVPRHKIGAGAQETSTARHMPTAALRVRAKRADRLAPLWASFVRTMWPPSPAQPSRSSCCSQTQPPSPLLPPPPPHSPRLHSSAHLLTSWPGLRTLCCGAPLRTRPSGCPHSGSSAPPRCG